MKVKAVLDELFENVDFNSTLQKNISRNNIDFITSTTEHKGLFGSRLIGCYSISYTQYHKNLFYEKVFNLTYEQVSLAIDKITSIPKHFKIARDDVNLICFYVAHRFLSSSLPTKVKEQATIDIFNYFNYRTLVLLSSNYWIYPIPEEKAVSLIERLNNKYIIKKLKNWNEYCNYRTSNYLSSRFVKIITNFTDDSELANAISDLFNGTKDTLKNIYREFLDMMDEDSGMRSSKSVVTDIDGQEVLLDRIENPRLYVDKVEATLADKHLFIKRDKVELTVSIIDSVSIAQVTEFLEITFDYYFLDKKTTEEVRNFISNFLINCFEYLKVNNDRFSSDGNIVTIVNKITGNILYTRGTSASITKVKEEGDQLITKVYKKSKISIGSRSRVNIRNAFCIYILLVSLLQ